MAGSTGVSPVATEAFPAVTLAPYIGGITGPKWQCPQVIMRAGPAASEAMCNIFLRDTSGSENNNVAVTYPDPPFGTPVKVYSISFGNDKTLIFSGYVTDWQRNIENQSVTVNAQDARWLLRGRIALGQYHWSAAGTPVYIPSKPCVMNPGGRPNCTIVDGKPVFCPPSMGLGLNQEPIVEDGKAGWWTPALAMSYFQFAATADDFYQAAISAGQNAMLPLPETVVWPESLGAIFDATEAPQSQEYTFEGKNYCTIIQELCDQSGPWGLYVIPGADVDTLTIVSTRFGAVASAEGTEYFNLEIELRDSGTITDTLFASAGTVQSSARESFTMALVQGDPVEIERRTQTTGEDNPTAADMKLIAAWSATEESDWKQYLKDNLLGASDGGSSVAKAAFAKYPRVYCAYKIDPAWDFTEGTAFSPYSRAEIIRTIGSRLRSAANPENNRIEQPFEIKFETADPTISPFQFVAWAENTGVRVDDDGIIWFETMRGDGSLITGFLDNTYAANVTDLTDQTAINTAVDDIAEVPIRATVVLQADARIVHAVSLGNDGSDLPVYKAPGTEYDAPKWAENLSRLKYADAAGKYQYQIAKDSWPVPQSSDGSVRNGDIIDDSARIVTAAQDLLDDAGRIDKVSVLVIPHVVQVYPVGTPISLLQGTSGSIPVYGVVHTVTYQSASGVNQTVLNLQ